MPTAPVCGNYNDYNVQSEGLRMGFVPRVASLINIVLGRLQAGGHNESLQVCAVESDQLVVASDEVCDESLGCDHGT